MFKLPIGRDLKELRKKAKLTQAALATKAGVSQSLIARIESDSVDPRLSTLRKIVEAIETSRKEQLTMSDVMISPVTSVKPDDTVAHAVELMRLKDYSQLPVINKEGTPIGTVQESTILNHLLTEDREKLFSRAVEDVMEDCLPCIPPSTPIDDAYKLFTLGYSGVLIIDHGRLIGIATKIDLISHRSSIKT